MGVSDPVHRGSGREHMRNPTFRAVATFVLTLGFVSSLPASAPVGVAPATPVASAAPGAVGVIAKFPLPNRLSTPYGITAGPDGNVWFTERYAERIGRISPDGAITEFPTAVVWPTGIAAGSDGNLWFTEWLNDNIGRVTPQGVITEFPSGAAYGIAAGPDGNLWFTEYKTATIGQITPSGKITEFLIPGNRQADPLSITPGPDGNLWFTEYAGNQIVRITDAPSPAVSLSPDSGPPTTVVQVSGSGYGSFETVVLTFIDSVTGRTSLGRVLTDANGKFSASVTIPTNATTGPQTVRVRGTISALVVDSTFTVT